MPALSPSKVQKLSPHKDELPSDVEDDFIEIPDSAGLSDATRNAIFNVWANEDLHEDSGFVDSMHYMRVTTFEARLIPGLSKRKVQTKKHQAQFDDTISGKTTSR
jgi:hypothetical protein